MPIFEKGNVKVEVDDDGFLVNFTDWNEEVARALAATEDLAELGTEHFQLMAYLRDYYKRNSAAPNIRKLCKDTNFSLKHIYELFPSGPARGACRVAGLPRPNGCL